MTDPAPPPPPPTEPVGGYPPPSYPPPAGYGAQRPPLPTYLPQAILATLFCCLPFGIVGIVFASRVSSLQAAGDYAGAQHASGQAKLWCWLSFGIGLAWGLLWTAIWVVAFASGAHSSGAAPAHPFSSRL